MTNHIKYRLHCIGLNLIDRLEIHNTKTGKRLTQEAKREEVRFLTRIASGARLFLYLDRGLWGFSVKVLLDTSFILPTLGIDTGKEVYQAPRKLDDKTQICFSSLTLVEALLAIARVSKITALEQETFERGLKSIVRSGRYQAITEPPEAYVKALNLYREGHKDTIDNIIYAVFVHLDIKLLTIDKVHSLRKNLKNTLISPSEL